ncbi:HNH endonuclease signature motif containing protein [uncultured Hyphomonas sp.]|uniref:HNH endonuclease n=1 Tax=uncultured Hyphomonas sp. TaxID=225298 RepID=UPI002AAAC722|nr:HNH endonuclease signature motif containing protein [uncultured Hyphomonas sp.]
MSQPYAPTETPLFKALWEAQEGRCALCGQSMPSNRFDVAHSTLWRHQRPTYDHIIAVARGGPDTADNLQLAHARCNKVKGMGNVRPPVRKDKD